MDALWNKYKGPIAYYLINAILLYIITKISEKNPTSTLLDWCLIPAKSRKCKSFVKFCRGRRYWSSPYRNLIHQKTYDKCKQNEKENEDTIVDNVEEDDIYACGNCLVTSWNLSHFVMYLLMGYLFPNIFFETLIIGIIFEFIESRADCYDVLDVVFNSSGYLIGVMINKMTRG